MPIMCEALGSVLQNKLNKQTYSDPQVEIDWLVSKQTSYQAALLVYKVWLVRLVTLGTEDKPIRSPLISTGSVIHQNC